jgi:hypothetical protein
MLTACAAVPTQPALDQATIACNTAGNQAACGELPYLRAQVSREKSDQAAHVAAGIALGLGALAAGAAAGYAAAHPAPVYYTPVVVCRWNCW